MRKLIKRISVILLAIACLSMVVLLADSINNLWISQLLNDSIALLPWLDSFFEIVLFSINLLLFLLLLIILSLDGKRNRLVIKTNGNTIEIRKSTIEELIKGVCNTQVPPQRSKVKVRIKRKNKIIVKLLIDVPNKEKAHLLSEKIEQATKEKLEKALESNANKVITKIREIGYSRKTMFRRKQSRVV